VSIESGYEGYVPKTRIVLFEAALAAAYGLTFDEALKTITINPAKLLGVDGRIGSLEVGKDADLVLFNGDPFEYTTNVTTVLIDGVVVYDKIK
jgi:imidazolonepropionase-like amidohydrolase